MVKMFARLLILFGLLFSATVVAQQVIDTRVPQYAAIGELNNVRNVNVGSLLEVRMAGGIAVRGALSLAAGTRFTLVWPNGSREDMYVACVNSTVCVHPIAGTQKNPDGSQADSNGAYHNGQPDGASGGGGSGGDGTPGHGGGGGYVPPGGGGGGWACSSAGSNGPPLCYWVAT